MSAGNPTKGERTRNQIEDAALELFMERGYHAASMRQIADRANLALGGIYNHFKSKEDIFEAIIVDKHPYRKILPAILEAEGESVQDFLRNAAHLALAELRNEPYYINLMCIEFVEFNGRHGDSTLRELAPLVLPVFEKITKGRQELRITNPALLMRSFFGMLISYFLTEMFIKNSHINVLMPKNPMDAFVDIYLHGILKESV